MLCRWRGLFPPSHPLFPRRRSPHFRWRRYAYFSVSTSGLDGCHRVFETGAPVRPRASGSVPAASRLPDSFGPRARRPRRCDALLFGEPNFEVCSVPGEPYPCPPRVSVAGEQRCDLFSLFLCKSVKLFYPVCFCWRDGPLYQCAWPALCSFVDPPAPLACGVKLRSGSEPPWCFQRSTCCPPAGFGEIDRCRSSGPRLSLP